MIRIIKKEWKNFFKMALIFLLATGTGYGFAAFRVQETNIVLIYVLAVLFISWFTNSLIWSIISSFVGTTIFNFFFTQPVFTLFVYDADYFLTFFCMASVAIFSAVLSLQTKKYSAQVYKERKQVEQEQYRTNLLRSISHDLRTPLMGIMGTSEMIMDMSKKDDPRKSLARDIYQDAAWLQDVYKRQKAESLWIAHSDSRPPYCRRRLNNHSRPIEACADILTVFFWLHPSRRQER